MARAGLLTASHGDLDNIAPLIDAAAACNDQ
jgi:hypothetical protein